MHIIGVTGGTASGKTSLVYNFKKEFSEIDLEIISQDSYYKATDELSFEERVLINFDHPNALDFDLLLYHLEQLQLGNSIEQPIYSFSEHNRISETKTIHPKKIILVEGILIFSDKRLLNLFHKSIFIDADADERFIRRVKRDIIERNRSFEEVSSRYLTTLKPMHEKFIEPIKSKVDFVIKNNNHNKIAQQEFNAIIKKYHE